MRDLEADVFGGALHFEFLAGAPAQAQHTTPTFGFELSLMLHQNLPRDLLSKVGLE